VVILVYSAPFDVRLPVGDEADDDITTVVQPDITVVCDKSKLDDKGCKGSPDLVVEIISPSSLKQDLQTKLVLYERFGVREYWVVYPLEQSVVVYLLQEDAKYQISEAYAKDELVPVSIFRDLTIDLTNIFTE
jgi:Uma2 family endonuclease